jgi:hypothetical protein
MSQNIGVINLNDGGVNSALNLSAATVIKAGPGKLFRAIIQTAATSGGAFTFNDSNALVTAQTITGITVAANAVVTLSTVSSANPFAVGNTIAFASVGGMTQINAAVGQVTAIGGSSGAWTVTTSINSSAFSAWTSGGSAASYSAANQILSIPEASTILNVVGAVIAVKWPCSQGILLSAVGSASGVIAASYM